MRTSILCACLVASATPALAGPHVKAELLCGVLVDGKIRDVVPSAKKPRIDQPVACALHLTRESDDTFMGNIHTVRYVKDASGKRTKLATQGETDDIENCPNLKKDVELVMTPGVKDSRDAVLLQPCEDFDVVGTVFDDRGTYFTKTIHVEQACAAAKPMKARVICFAQNSAGDRVDLPDRKQRSLDGYHVQCYAESSDERLPHARFYAYTEYDHPTMDDSAGHTKNPPRTGKYEDGEDESGSLLQLDDDDVPVCLPAFEIHLFLDDAAGAHLFQKTVTVHQKC